MVFTEPAALKAIDENFEMLFDTQCLPADKKALKLKWYEYIGKVIMTPFAPLL